MPFSQAVNGIYYVIEAVPDANAKTVVVVSEYMSKKSTGDVQTAHAEALRVTSETKNAQSPVNEASASNVIVSQEYENNKALYEEPDGSDFYESSAEYAQQPSELVSAMEMFARTLATKIIGCTPNDIVEFKKDYQDRDAW